MTEPYGASLEAWHHWAERLGLAQHLLPVVANPDAKISPDSNMKALGKTPSKYNFRGEAAGFPKWTEHTTTMKEIGKWELETDYGICVQAREVRAFDIDVPGRKHSERIVAAIENALPTQFFSHRYRESTGKVLLPFLFEEPLTKHMLRVEGGVVELLADGQQWIAESTYLSHGKADGRYLWRGGWPTDFPVLTRADLDEVLASLDMLFGDGTGWTIARQRREGTGVSLDVRPGADEVTNWLVEKWELRGEKSDGTLFIRCPFESGHSGDSGPSETQYAPPGNGYEQGHFKCLHASCMGKTDGDYLEAVGWSPDMSDAPELPDMVEESGTEIERVEPRYMLDKQGRKENRAYNHELFLGDVESVGLEIAWDNYLAQIGWRRRGTKQWREFSDEHYQKIVMQMDRNGFVPQSASAIRGAVHAHAKKHEVDTLVDWVNALPEWDGVERVKRFWVERGKAADTPYIEAIGLYSWTAQAGRALDPGCQADMVPVLVGEQGARKTSLVRAIAPAIEQFVEINLMHRDEDTTRNIRGVCVGELGELRGLQSRDKEDIKAFLTRREEKWVPKYKEFSDRFKRRLVMYGTANRDDFLGDETGERRWLPFWVGLDGEVLDVEGAERDREQLWAEAVVLWREHGVMWQEAERLGAGEHGDFKEEDPWSAVVLRWLLTPGALDDAEKAPVDMDYGWDISDVLVGALGKRTADLKRQDQTRVGGILASLGCTKKRVWKKGWKYRAYREHLHSDDELFL